MSARRDLIWHLTVEGEAPIPVRLASRQVDAVRAEVRWEDAARLLNERRHHANRAIFCDGITHAAHLLKEWADDAPEKETGDGSQPIAGESTPELHGIVLKALGGGQGTLLPLPAATQRLLADRVTEAVRPLVPYRPVWDGSLPPGSYVCSVCGQPVESEPCPEHAPDFFQPGHTYAYAAWKFRCDTVTTHPGTGERTALGWFRTSRGAWRPFSASQREWAEGVWKATVTESGEA